MHGLNTIKRLNRTEQDFVDHILSTPIKDINLLQVWQEWKEESNQKQRELVDEPVSLSTD